MARQDTLTMTALLSQRHDADPFLGAPRPAEMAVWDPAEDLSDPALAFQRADQRGLRMLGGVGLAALVLILGTALVQWLGA